MQPPLAQVGGAGVQSTSQTEVRKLEEVSQSSHQAAVVQLAQGERMSVHSMGSDDTRGQSRGSALVEAALVVGLRHEPVGPCTQYELGGPGIPQVMTGGMPSGVYLTLEGALTQQYMSRESQMITGGMPSGVPPSVCLPADAMCQPYVNSHVMKSQVTHTDMMRYSSKIPEPVESVRYFAPNTCSPVNAREPALSYSWSQSEETRSSDERSEADQALGICLAHRRNRPWSEVEMPLSASRLTMKGQYVHVIQRYRRI